MPAPDRTAAEEQAASRQAAQAAAKELIFTYIAPFLAAVGTIVVGPLVVVGLLSLWSTTSQVTLLKSEVERLRTQIGNLESRAVDSQDVVQSQLDIKELETNHSSLTTTVQDIATRVNGMQSAELNKSLQDRSFQDLSERVAVLEGYLTAKFDDKRLLEPAKP